MEQLLEPSEPLPFSGCSQVHFSHEASHQGWPHPDINPLTMEQISQLTTKVQVDMEKEERHP